MTEVSCYADSDRHFDSASIVKAIILAALLRWHHETGTPLSPEEKREATLMITQSDNDAATDLWNEVGMSRLQHFLDLAKMSETELGQRRLLGADPGHRPRRDAAARTAHPAELRADGRPRAPTSSG